MGASYYVSSAYPNPTGVLGVGECNQNPASVGRREKWVCFFLNPHVLYYPTGEDGVMEIAVRLAAEV